MIPTSAGWHFWVDRGGTFTDIVARSPTGEQHSHKVFSHSSTSRHPSVRGIKELLQNVGIQGSLQELTSEVRVGTTVATNALLEREGARVGLIVTEGFRDLLTIGDQARPDLFALKIERPTALYEVCCEVPERLSVTGEVLTPVDHQAVYNTLYTWDQMGIESVAVLFLHSTINPIHELAVEDLARSFSFSRITLSHQIAPLPRAVTRGMTAVLDAYLSPPLLRYTDDLTRELSGIPLYCMTSAGGLVKPEEFSGAQALLSGPAGGMIGAVEAAQQAGFSKCIGLDIGGTSADVFFWDGTLERRRETVIAGIHVQLPTLKIHTIASGGGSVISLRAGQLQVGPASAGSHPGPACYGRGGPATLTDANVILGRLDPNGMPAIFGADGCQRINPEASYLALSKVSGLSSRDELIGFAQDVVCVAEEKMAQAIRHITLSEGRSIEGSVLVAFGGAGGQHACAIAELLGLREVLFHPFAGVLSAWGIGQAQRLWFDQQGVDLRVNQLREAELNKAFEKIEDRIFHGESLASFKRSELSTRHILHAQLGRGEAHFEVIVNQALKLEERLDELYLQRFGHPKSAEAEWRISLLRVSVTTQAIQSTAPTALSHVCKTGPCLVSEPLGALYIGRRWIATHRSDGGWVLKFKHTQTKTVLPMSQTSEPRMNTTASSLSAELALFQNRFMAIAEEMGAALQQSAQSVNIRERLDYSCAVFDEQGNLIAHAPHIPVHLGSMSAAVKEARKRWPSLTGEDAVILNSPEAGGTHLPDVTVIVKLGDVAWLAARGHHEDIGGITSGSMPAHSRSLNEEGVILDGMLVNQRVFLEKKLRERLNKEPWPARRPDLNIADIRAQLASVKYGQEALSHLIRREGVERVKGVMKSLLDAGEQVSEKLLTQLVPCTAEYSLDHGQVIKVSLSLKQEDAQSFIHVDFTGTAPAVEGNRNAPASVTRSVLLYVLRLWAGEGTPLNEGLLRRVKLNLPTGSLLNPFPDSAVVAGNVETSQAVADLLLEAFGLLANSQGTMNNVTIGWPEGSYYETICGGAGAGNGFSGQSGIHTHMTNSRLTDPEVLEATTPLELVRFQFRKNSGGQGRWQGGDGVERIFKALRDLEVSLISSRRSTSPRGLHGGGEGEQGENAILRENDGGWTRLSGDAAFTLRKGDLLRIRTPGGGGVGGSY